MCCVVSLIMSPQNTVHFRHLLTDSDLHGSRTKCLHSFLLAAACTLHLYNMLLRRPLLVMVSVMVEATVVSFVGVLVIFDELRVSSGELEMPVMLQGGGHDASLS